MKLSSNKDLIVLKLETTGVSITESKIIQINLLKVFADGKAMESKCKLINPGIKIPQIVTDLTGINDEMVKDQPSFKKYAKGIFDFIGDSDIVTYSGSEFDIPILMEHFEKSGLILEMSDRKTIDVLSIFAQMERRDLKAAVHKFIGKSVTGPLRGERALKATLAVLEAMLDHYNNIDCIKQDDTIIKSPIKNDIESLSSFSNGKSGLDFACNIILNEEGVPIMNFGMYKDKPVVPTLIDDEQYYNWIMNKSKFTQDTRRVIKNIVNEYKSENQPVDLVPMPSDINMI